MDIQFDIMKESIINNISKLIDEYKSKENTLYKIEKSIYDFVIDFHDWVDTKEIKGIHLVRLPNGEAFWILLIVWNDRYGWYTVVFPESIDGPLIEAHTVKDNSIQWKYSPRKQDGKNKLRKDIFIKKYGSADVFIKIPNSIDDIETFFEELFKVSNDRIICDNLGKLIGEYKPFDPILKLISNYKKKIKETKLEEEVYKWELAKQYRGKPNIQADNFTKEITSIKYENLIYSMGIAVVRELSKDYPEDLRTCFANLFNEKIEIDKRVKEFSESTLKLYRQTEAVKSHHQDERTIATHLTFYNSSKYTFYKDSFYQKYCKLIGEEPVKVGEKYVHYLQLINQLVDNYILKDKELINLVKKLIPDYYDGTNNMILAQDILYSLDTSENEINYWIFQGSPKIYDVVGSLKDEALKSWSIKAHKDKIKIGDKIIIWVTGKNSGCYALAEVTSDVEKKKDDIEEKKYYKTKRDNVPSDQVEIKIIHNLYDKPITKGEIDKIPELKNLKVGSQGTNFSLSEKEYFLIKEMAENIINEEKEFLNVFNNFNIQDLLFFYNQIDFIFNELGIKTHTNKLTLSVPNDKNRLNVIFGQSYIFCIQKNQNKTIYDITTSVKINETSTIFNNQDNAYYTKVTSHGVVKNNINKIIDIAKFEYNRTVKSGFSKYSNRFFVKSIFDLKYREKIFNKESMKISLNQILFGPPGTGKTYHTINKSLEIIDPSFLKENINNRNALTKRFKELVDSGQIVFTTFHQSMSYEDFVEGIKPKTVDNEVQYEIEDGIFKRLSITAFFANVNNSNKNVISQFNEFDNLYNKYIENIEKRLNKLKKDEILKLPLRSKGYFTEIKSINEDEDYILTKGGKANSDVKVTKDRLRLLYNKFKSIDDIKDVSSDIRSVGKGLGWSSNYYGVFKDLKEFEKNVFSSQRKENNSSVDYTDYEKIKKIMLDTELPKLVNETSDSFVMIIDEINRGNVSSIFGELITLIEEDKRKEAKEALEVTLPYSKEKFSVPSNLYIIGTMNTADRSVEALDTALRRRFSFVEMPSKPSLIETEGQCQNGILDDIDLVELLSVINKRIEKLIDKDHMIGHSYFLSVKKLDDLKLVFHNKIIPLLQEYFFGDYGKIGLVIGSGFIKQEEDNNDEFFADFDYEIDSLIEKPIYNIVDINELSNDEFIEAIGEILRY